MIKSKVIRYNRCHITRAHYNNTKPLLGLENVKFPVIGSLQSRVLRLTFSIGSTLSHREFDFESHSYRLGSFIDKLRDKGWTIVNHDESVLTKDKFLRIATYTRYELFAEFSPELAEKIKAFCKAFDEFEAKAVAQQYKEVACLSKHHKIIL